MQVVLVYLEWFRHNSLLKCVLQPKLPKNSLKTPILGFTIVQNFRFIPLESSSAVLVTISSKFVSVCNRFYARQLYRQILLRARISYGDSVRLSVRLSVCHDPVVYQAQMR